MDLKFDEIEFDFDSGKLCLDFTNTADWHASPTPDERLNSYHDLLLWGRAANVLDESELQRLEEATRTNPDDVKKVFERAIELREVLYRIFSSVAQQETPEQADLDLFNVALQEALAHLRLTGATDGFKLNWDNAGKALDRMLWPVVQSAVDLLSSDDLSRVGECADDRGCGYLFYDTSRNHSRRWCSMESCGNRAKAMRHYERQQSE
jgi:predicted RNA-binding Zn ribbon-like protein